jgi:hypothetical protein
MELLMADIFATNPYGQPVKRTSLLEGFNQGADTVFNLYDKKYKNQQEAAKAQYAQSTLDDSIAAANAKNQADTQYYPQQQLFKTQQEMFKTQQEEQTVKEIMARTGLSYAQAREAAARTGLIDTQQQVLANPFTQTHNMIQQWQQLPTDSHEKIMLGSLLDGSASAGQMFPSAASKGGGKAGTMTGTLPGLGAPGWVRDPRMGSTRGGAGGTYINPNSGEIVSSDTATQAARDQRAIAGTENVKQYIDTIIDTLPKYQTLGSQAGLWKDRLSNFAFGTKYLGPDKNALGNAAIKASAEGFLNTFQLNATEGNVQTAMDILKPEFGESGEGYKARVVTQLSDFAKQQQRARDRLGEGTTVGQAPASPAQLGYFTRNSVSDPSILMPQQAQGATQPSTQEETAQIPQFNTPDEFRAWFQLQSPAMQAQIAAKLPKKGQ